MALTPPGTIVRKILFWGHLVAGMASAIILAVVAATGVVMTYERQIIRAAEGAAMAGIAPAERRLTADILAVRAADSWPEVAALQLVIETTPHWPVRVMAGRRFLGLISPYDGLPLEDTGKATRDFFAGTRALHRWLLQDGDTRMIGRRLVSAATILFVLMVFSGLYLWMPRVWTRNQMTPRLAFTAVTASKRVSAAARDFAWHNSFGFWTAAVLLVLSLSGLVFAFKDVQNWTAMTAANIAAPASPALTAPAQVSALLSTSGHSASGQSSSAKGSMTAESPALSTPLQAMLDQVLTYAPKARRVHMYLPDADAGIVQLRSDAGSGAQPRLRTDFDFDAPTAEMLQIRPFSATEPGRRTVIWLRYLHTGEYYGLIGQTVAGLASAAMLLLIYTGTVMAFRRLARLRRRTV